MARTLCYDTFDPENPPANWPATGRAILATGAKTPHITAKALSGRITNLLRSAVGDDVLFYFAGHAHPTASGLLLATSEDNPDQVRAGVYVDELLTLFACAQVNSATIILDCCHAGLAATTNVERNVVIMAGAAADQEASEFSGRGQFTRFLLDGLAGGAADILGRITALSLYSYVAGMLNYLVGQEPIIKANIEDLLVLKRVKGKVSLRDLRRLAPRDDQAGRFSTRDTRIKLTPDHEATAEQSSPPLRSRPHPAPAQLTELQQDMDYYKRLRNAGLLETVGGDDLFWTCLAGGQILLNPLGQYYWELAHRGWI